MIMSSTVLLLCCVLFSVGVHWAQAFMLSSPSQQAIRFNSALFSKRNTKEEKRIRNRMNARQFGGEKSEERKKEVIEEKRQRIAEQEQAFIEKCFVATNDEDYPEYHEFDDFFDEFLF